jgi:serine/threonine-protein kinase
LQAHLRSKPVRLSEFTRLPEDLDEIVHSCLAKDPADRPQSANALAEQLRAVRFSDPWTLERATGWWDSHQDELDTQRTAGSTDKTEMATAKAETATTKAEVPPRRP